MPTYSNTSSFRHRVRTALRLGAASLLLLLGAAVSRAENPWMSSSMGWSTGPSHWSSWETTRGGSFDSPSFSRPSPQTETFRVPAPAPMARRDASIDPVMLKAGSIAEQRALPRSTMRCWRFVKEALVAAGSVSSYPQTPYAKQAGDELVRNYGFVRLSVRCAAQAPVGSVIVYGGAGAGHVELRTAHGFVSDFYHRQPSNMPFIGAYTRMEKRTKQIQTAQIDGILNTDS
ncbi:MAG TPA: hypothetical protein VK961_12665 [Chthoniobacter sp.]|nr:hypothetical protein [Chthoniobacter sp.]